ncbi:HD domain-containing protein [Lactococcus hircilactis]|uniref:HD domain-containing protein n=1 Tax=Lactococcus hircilactis TaxID=1494462 RepID=A0A7X1Z7T9_9LACT|nr:HD domain-containing protein [Lactococcus hircilactis]MQW39401.1 HD domain-containing protein [Lactococcus hircilactis]
MKKIEKQVDFISELEKLKIVTRHNKTLDDRFENSAEHSWQSAITAVILEEYFPITLDMEKVMKMLLIHDLGEIYAGDTWLYDDKGKKYAHEKEYSSIHKSLGILPQKQAQVLQQLWLEFETGNSPEARYGRVIDALIPLINHLVISKKNYNPDQLSTEMVLKKKKFIENESQELWNLVLKLIALSVKKGIYK